MITFTKSLKSAKLDWARRNFCTQSIGIEDSATTWGRIWK